MRTQFFGEKGLTSTSANHIANMAKEYIKSIQEQINSISFIEETTSAGGHKYTTRKSSTFSLKELESKLAQISQATQLIAWLREGLKEKENAKNSLINLNQWCEQMGKVLPKQPISKPYITEEEIISSWPVDKYNSFLTAQTNAAVLGAFVHPGEPYSKARKQLFDSLNNPVTVTGSGRDLTVVETSPAKTLEDVDNTFFQLQAKYREWQAKFNQYRHDIDTQIEEDMHKKDSEHKTALSQYYTERELMTKEYEIWRDSELSRIRNLKIIIPDALKTIYNTIQGLSK